MFVYTGIIPGVKSFSHQLDLSEIFEIGLHAYDEKDYSHAREWLRTALDEFGANDKQLDGYWGPLKKSKVIDYLAFSEFKVCFLFHSC